MVEVFEAADFDTIDKLRHFDCEDRKLWEVIQKLKTSCTKDFDSSYWKRLMTRCINVVYRARSSESADFVPHEYMCPLSLDWFEDAVVTASGHSYSRSWLSEHLDRSQSDPLTRMDLTDKPLYDNISLRKTVDHHRLHYQRFRILC